MYPIFFYLNMCFPTRITTKLVEFCNAVDHIPLVETVLFDRWQQCSWF